MGLAVSVAPLGVLGVGCSPALDWREVHPEDSGLTALFPCKPSSHARPVALGDVTVSMYLYVCEAGGATFSVSYTLLSDPAAVVPAIAAWRDATARNVAGLPKSERPMIVPGMTPQPAAMRALYDGRAPSGAAVQWMAGWFVEGTRVYQAAVMAPRLDAEGVDTFFDGLRLGAAPR